MNVDAGAYAIFGKSQLDVQPITDASGYGQCRIVAGSDIDISGVNLGGQAQQVSRASVAMMINHTFGAAGQISLECNKGGSTVTANYSKITAIKVGTATNEPVG